MEFPFISRLLEFWVSLSDKSERSNWRKTRAEQMGDTQFRADVESTPAEELEKKKEEMLQRDFKKSSGARHLDCAPGHVQEAVARFKAGKHLEIPEPPKENN
jgi:hypothetical protein